MRVFESVGLGQDASSSESGRDLDVDPLVLLDLGALVDVGDAGGEEQVDHLVGEAGRGVERAERLPVRRPACRSPPRARAWPPPAGPRPRRRACRRGSRAGRGRRSPRAAGGRTTARSSSSTTIPTAPGCVTISRSTSSPSSWRNVLAADGEELALVQGLGVDALEAGAHAAPPPRRGGEKRDVEHPLERGDARRARSARGCARCRWRG